jgi:pyruvate/2-oxoglutarate/acetoin dehydrogenase E1 component
MSDDDRIVLLGEDIRDPYGGAFRVTAGLSEAFPERVYNTPISEAGIVGIGNGLALAGWRPVVEIMFGDFLMLAADQIINHAAKFAWMYNGQASVPLVLRTPMGGYRGYGPTHSQCLEKHLLGLPGTRILALHRRYCPGQVYRALLTDNDRPTLVIEHKLLYGQSTDPTPPRGHTMTASEGPFPTIRISPEDGAQLTVVAYGWMVNAAEKAMAALQDEDLACELLIPTQLYPLDIESIVDSVSRSGRLLVVEEGQGFAGLGSELIAQLATDQRVGSFEADRICAAPCPIPASKPAEQAVLPCADDIIKAAIALATRTATS